MQPLIEAQSKEYRQAQPYKHLSGKAGVPQKIPVIIITVRWHVLFR
jgi:hypothetical protein